MKYLTLTLLVLMAACSEDEPASCEIEPEPFRFTIIDQSGNRQLTADNQPANTSIFYLRGGDTEEFLELYFRGNTGARYGESPVLPVLSAGAGIETYYLKRNNSLDTLFVQVSGDNCVGYAYDTVVFNGVAAALDNTVDPPVYVLVE